MSLASSRRTLLRSSRWDYAWRDSNDSPEQLIPPMGYVKSDAARGAKSGAPSIHPSELDPKSAMIINAWRSLPEPIRQAMEAWQDLSEPARQALVSAAQLALAVRQSRSNLTEQSKTGKGAL